MNFLIIREGGKPSVPSVRGAPGPAPVRARAPPPPPSGADGGQRPGSRAGARGLLPPRGLAAPQVKGRAAARSPIRLSAPETRLPRPAGRPPRLPLPAARARGPGFQELPGPRGRRRPRGRRAGPGSTAAAAGEWPPGGARGRSRCLSCVRVSCPQLVLPRRVKGGRREAASLFGGDPGAPRGLLGPRDPGDRRRARQAVPLALEPGTRRERTRPGAVNAGAGRELPSGPRFAGRRPPRAMGKAGNSAFPPRGAVPGTPGGAGPPFSHRERRCGRPPAGRAQRERGPHLGTPLGGSQNRPPRTDRGRQSHA